MKDFQEIFQQPFIRAIIDRGGEVYAVGGCVRDYMLELDPKDVDLVVRLVPYQELNDILSDFGKVDLVGESFGVIKFKSFGQEYDISLPRTDKKIQGEKGHKSIESQSDHMMELEADMLRRDFTINAIALTVKDGKTVLYDYFDGTEDLYKGIIRCVSPDAFVEDPLRMLRALQFAARFRFTIDAETFLLIFQHKGLIRDITPERMLMEFQKVIDKDGDIVSFAGLLNSSGLFKEFFGRDIHVSRVSLAVRLSEFLHFAIADTVTDTADFFKERLTIDNDTYREMQALNIVYNSNLALDGRSTMYHIIFDALRKSDIVLRSAYVSDSFVNPFIIGLFPKNRSELSLTGDDLIGMGFKQGKEVGDMLNVFLDEIFNGRVRNTREELEKLVSERRILA